jgi:hypothetical protein
MLGQRFIANEFQFIVEGVFTLTTNQLYQVAANIRNYY